MNTVLSTAVKCLTLCNPRGGGNQSGSLGPLVYGLRLPTYLHHIALHYTVVGYSQIPQANCRALYCHTLLTSGLTGCCYLLASQQDVKSHNRLVWNKMYCTMLMQQMSVCNTLEPRHRSTLWQGGRTSSLLVKVCQVIYILFHVYSCRETTLQKHDL